MLIFIELMYFLLITIISNIILILITKFIQQENESNFYIYLYLKILFLQFTIDTNLFKYQIIFYVKLNLKWVLTKQKTNI
jgi:hypothetical protein